MIVSITYFLCTTSLLALFLTNLLITKKFIFKMALPLIENLQINPPTLKQKVEGYGPPRVGYLGWYLKYFNQDRINVEQLKVALLTNDHIIWTAEGQFEEFVMVDVLATQMNITFLHILTGESDVSSEWIAKAEATIGRMELKLAPTQPPLYYSLKHLDHLNGIKVILKSLKVLHALQFNETIDSNVIRNSDFDKPKEIAVFKIFEQRFIYEFVTNPEMEMELVKDAIDLDPDWEWVLMKNRQLRWNRQSRNIHRLAETDEENILLRRVMELNPNHPLCIVNNCESLALCLKNMRKPIGNGFRLEHGGQVFNSRDEVVTYLKTQAKQFEAQYPSPSWMFAFSKIFCYNPHLSFALGLLDAGLLTAPESSKLNHRKAIVLAKLGQFEEADACIRISVKSDGRNKAAVLDMAKLLLRNRNLSPVEEELRQLFNDEYFAYWRGDNKPAAVVDTLFLKGYFFMRINNVDAAIEAWMDWAPNYQRSFNQGRNFLQFNFKVMHGLEQWGWGWQLGNAFEGFVHRARQALIDFGRRQPSRRQEDFQLLRTLMN